jgi:hypothetical protein
MKLFRNAVAAVVLGAGILGPIDAFAQAGTGAISGVVKDTSGATVPARPCGWSTKPKVVRDRQRRSGTMPRDRPRVRGVRVGFR